MKVRITGIPEGAEPPEAWQVFVGLTVEVDSQGDLSKIRSDQLWCVDDLNREGHLVHAEVVVQALADAGREDDAHEYALLITQEWLFLFPLDVCEIVEE